MIDGFKVKALTLKRNLKVSVYLPDEYYKVNKSYPLVIAFDGQDMFKFLMDDYKVFDMNSILSAKNREFIVVAPHAPREDMPDWRISELNPYYKGDIETVDSSLALTYANYITNELIPLLKMKYRFKDEIYLLGMKDSAILSLYMVYAFPNYRGAIMFSPNLKDCNHKVFEDLDARFDKTKKIYLYQGEKVDDEIDADLFYDLQSTIDKSGAEYLVLDYDLDKDNSIESIIEHLDNGLNIVEK